MELPDKINRLYLDPSAKIRLPNELVTEPWEYLEKWARKMFGLMYAVNGVGLSACQVGWNVQLFVMNPDKDRRRSAERVFWNPSIFGTEGDPEPMREGCLSLPKVFGNVKRFPGIVLKAMTPAGERVELFRDFPAQVVQHEMDHMAGKVCWEKFTDEPERKPSAAPPGQPGAAAPPVA